MKRLGRALIAFAEQLKKNQQEPSLILPDGQRKVSAETLEAAKQVAYLIIGREAKTKEWLTILMSIRLWADFTAGIVFQAGGKDVPINTP